MSLLTHYERAFERERNRRVALQGYSGQLRLAIKDALDHAHPGTSLHAILEQALNIQPPEGA